MSEFSCVNGHLVSPRSRFCPECGKPCLYMDGKSARELMAEEREAELRSRNPEEESENDGERRD